jgi:hypothetical protein
MESAKSIHKRELRGWVLGKILFTQTKKGLTAEVKRLKNWQSMQRTQLAVL